MVDLDEEMVEADEEEVEAAEQPKPKKKIVSLLPLSQSKAITHVWFSFSGNRSRLPSARSLRPKVSCHIQTPLNDFNLEYGISELRGPPPRSV